MQVPYFTFPDPALVRSGGGRDPLGLQPVWSAFGRGLVPNLASPVTQVNGIKAVLMIHWLYEKPLEKFFSEGDLGFRQFFRLMEGLLEYFLWSALPTHDGHSFGTRALAAEGDNFKVTSRDSRTAVNGLYQYYRGTCRRSELLDSDWSVSIEVNNALSGCWDEKATSALADVLQSPLLNPNAAFVPSAVFKQHPGLKGSVQAIFSSQRLKEILQHNLLGDAGHLALAEKCAGLIDQDEDYGKLGWSYWSLSQLNDWMQSKECPAKALLSSVSRAQKCEPFLLVLQDCFDLMLASPGEKILALSMELQNHSNRIQQRARDFLTLSSSLNSDRMAQMLTLAEISLSDMPLFLTSILKHHHKCMIERGRDPMALLDEDKIVVPVDPGRNKDAIMDRLESGIPWANGYYLWNAGVIHRQLFGGQNG